MLTRLFDNTKPNSLANKFRIKRFKFLLELIKDLPKPVKILDLGGTEIFWKMMKFSSGELVNVTIINTEIINITLPNFNYINKDARSLSGFKDKEFDVVFSNSVIEHVGSYADQQKMADEILRTGCRYFIQTPNIYFPIEPHFMFPFFQFIPEKIKIFLLTNFNLGFYKKSENKKSAGILARSVNLLSKRKLKKLFPGSVIYKEKFLFLTKSFVCMSKIY